MAGSFFSELMSTLFERRFGRLTQNGKRPIVELCEELMSGVGEVSGVRIAREILACYRQMDSDAKVVFFRYLTDKLDIIPEKLINAATAYAQTPDGEHLGAVITAAEPRRQELLRRINQAPGATGDLVRIRLDLLSVLKQHPEFARADLDFAHLFRAWFNRGFLVLRHIDWGTPAALLEKIIEYEAVHTINDWNDLRRRLMPADRRCFAFFHPAMPNEPLIFVEVALTRDIPGSIQELLAEERPILEPNKAKTAVFYSISNCQEGLRGISFGNSLIKHVVEELSRELPHLETFVTLSPMPGFAQWLKERASAGEADAVSLLATVQQDPAALEAAAETTQQLAARYLLEGTSAKGFPLDPVARFHLGNGALAHRVHALADRSKNGLKQSCGAMVNYLYDLKAVEQNHENYAADGTVTASREIRALVKASEKARQNNSQTARPQEGNIEELP